MSQSLDQTKPLVAALRRSALFGHVPLRQLAVLASRAEDVQLNQGEVVYDDGVTADALYVVRAGRLQDFGRDADGKTMIRRQLRPGDAFGETAVVLGTPTRSRVVAGEATTLARILAADLHKLMAQSSAFRRALFSAVHPEMESVHAATTVHDDHNVELVAIHGPDSWPLGDLALELARALDLNHRDRVAVLHILAAEPKHPHEPSAAGSDGVVHVDAGPDPDAFLNSALGKLLYKQVDYLLLDLTDANASARRNWTAHATKLASLRPPGDASVMDGVRDAIAVCESVLMPEFGSVYPHVLPTGAARVRLTQADLAKPLVQWGPVSRKALDKWARHVSDRMVGIALGGGGAWGYAHVALIEELLARDIPIDIVAGVSFGSMVGAYYCAAGEDGLQKLVAAGPRLEIIVQGAIVSSSIIGWKVKRDVGDPWLDDLDTVFLPVACDIAAAETTALRGVGLALGATASSSFPTVFSPTTASDPVAKKLRRYVDGGISDNVPDGPILAEGADLVIGSNIMPPPRSEPASRPLFPGRVGRALHAMNPALRLDDGYRSVFMMFHTAGESESLAVDAMLNTRPTGYLITAFGRAREIMAQSRTLAQATADQALLRWQAMQGRG